MNNLSLIKNNQSSDKNFTKQNIVLSKIKEFKEFINIQHDKKEIKKYIEENVKDKSCNKNTSIFAVSNTRSQSYLYIIFFILITKKSTTLKIDDYKEFINFYKEYGLDLNTMMMGKYFKELANNISFTSSNGIFSKKHNSYNLNCIQKRMLSEYYSDGEKASEIKEDLQKKHRLLKNIFGNDLSPIIEDHVLLHTLQYSKIEELITSCQKNVFEALFSNEIDNSIKYALENKIIDPTVLNSMSYKQLINLNLTFFKLIEYKISTFKELNENYEKTSYLVSKDCRNFIEFHCKNQEALKEKAYENFWCEKNCNFKLFLSNKEISVLKECLKSDNTHYTFDNTLSYGKSVFDTATSLDIIHLFSFSKIKKIKHEDENQKESFDKAYKLLSEKFSTISILIPFLNVKNSESIIIKNYLSKYSDIIVFNKFKNKIESLKSKDKYEEKLKLFYSIDKEFLKSEEDLEKLFDIFKELDLDILKFFFNNKDVKLNSLIRKALSKKSSYYLSPFLKNFKNILEKYPHILNNIIIDEESSPLLIKKNLSISSKDTDCSDSDPDPDPEENNTISEQVFIECVGNNNFNIIFWHPDQFTKLLKKSNTTIEFIVKNYKTVLPVLDDLFNLIGSDKENFINFNLLLYTISDTTTNNKLRKIISNCNFNNSIIYLFNYRHDTYNYQEILDTLKKFPHQIENLELLYYNHQKDYRKIPDNIFEGLSLEELLSIDKDKLKVLISICRNSTLYPYGKNAKEIINSNLFQHPLLSEKFIVLMKSINEKIFLQFLEMSISEFDSIFKDNAKFILLITHNASNYFNQFPDTNLHELLKFSKEKLSLLFSKETLEFWQYYALDKNPFEDLDELGIRTQIKTPNKFYLNKNINLKLSESNEFLRFIYSTNSYNEKLLLREDVKQYLSNSMVCTNEIIFKEFCKLDSDKIKQLSLSGIINSLNHGFDHEFLSNLSSEKIEIFHLIFEEGSSFANYAKNQDSSFIDIIKNLFNDNTLDNELLLHITSPKAISLYEKSKTSIEDLAYLNYVSFSKKGERQSLEECKNKLKLIFRDEVIKHLEKNPTIVIHQQTSKYLKNIK